jgi:hypothetical protein
MLGAHPYTWTLMAKNQAPKDQQGPALYRAVDMSTRLALAIHELQGPVPASRNAAMSAGALAWPDVQALVSFAENKLGGQGPGQEDALQRVAAPVLANWSALLAGYQALVDSHAAGKADVFSVPELSDPRSAPRFSVLLKLLAQVLLNSNTLQDALLLLRPGSASTSTSASASASASTNASSGSGDSTGQASLGDYGAAYVHGLQIVQRAAAFHNGQGSEMQPVCLQEQLLQHWLGHCKEVAEAAVVSPLLLSRLCTYETWSLS